MTSMSALIVDDSRSSATKLRLWIEDIGPVEIRTCLDPAEGLAAALARPFDFIVVDHVMPKMDGIALVEHLRRTPHHDRTPILMVTASSQLEVRLAALEAGANDVLQKSAHPLELQSKIRNFLLLAEAARVLDSRVSGLAAEVEAAITDRLAREEEMIFRLSKAVEFRDNDTGDHTLRVATYSRMIAETLDLDAEYCRRIFLASPLHDVGKVAIPDQILLKPGRLDADEMALIRTHAEIGMRILEGSSCEIVQLAAEIAGAHHERWDGTGYPHGLATTAIPLSARIVAVADVYDALMTERPYKQAFSQADALAYLEKERGRHFDPACVDAFLRALPDLGCEAEEAGGGAWFQLQACASVA